MRAMAVLQCLTMLPILLFTTVAAEEQTCNLSFDEKFNPACSNLDLSPPPVIYQDMAFSLRLLDDSLVDCCPSFHQLALYASTDDYCGNLDTGHQCSFNTVTSIGGNAAVVETVSTVKCGGEGSQVPSVGPVVLVGNISYYGEVCAINISTTWGQGRTVQTAVPCYHGYHVSIFYDVIAINL